MKERYRAHVCTLPYDLSMQLSEWLVAFCVSRLKLFPLSGTTRSVLSTQKLTYERNVRMKFGEYVQAIDPTISVKKQ